MRGGNGPRRGNGHERAWAEQQRAAVGEWPDGLVIRRVVLIAAGGTGALVIGIVVLISAGAGNSPSGCGAGPSAAGQPPMIQYYIQAAAAANLGPDGYAYLAGINHVESGFGSSTLPGVDSGTNLYGAAGPMQIGVDGQAGNTWGGLMGRIPVSLPGGASPPSVYNAEDAIYGAAFYLADSGAPGDWPNAVFSYNHAGWYVQQVTDYAQSYMGPTGLAKLASDIASFYGGKEPPTLVGLTTSTTTPTASPAPSIDGPSGQTLTSGESSTSAAATAGGPGIPGGSGDCGAVDAQGYANPCAQSQGLTPLRIDMGVDYTASGSIDAVGDGTISYAAQGTGWGPYSCSGGGAGAVVEQLSDGSEKGRWVYIAEGLVPTVARA